MPRTNRKTRFAEMDLADQVRRARRLAPDIVLLGAVDVERYDTTNENLASRVEALVGHGGPDIESRHEGKDGITSESQYERWDDSLAGAFALGIAVGQLVSPAAFTKGR